MWQFRARCERVIDGDTLQLRVDSGFNMQATVRVRLLGVNTPELHADDEHVRLQAREAMAFVQDRVGKLEGDWPLIIETQKADSFGRWLAKVSYPEGTNMLDLSTELLARKLAIPFKR